MITCRGGALAGVFGVAVMTFGPLLANPTNCDNKCRMRQYFYSPYAGAGQWKYTKFEKAVCGRCAAANSLCLPNANDDTTLEECYVPAGQEMSIKSWEITSKSVCDMPTGTQWNNVEANAAEPADTMMFHMADYDKCRLKPVAGGD